MIFIYSLVFLALFFSSCSPGGGNFLRKNTIDVEASKKEQASRIEAAKWEYVHKKQRECYRKTGNSDCYDIDKVIANPELYRIFRPDLFE